MELSPSQASFSERCESQGVSLEEAALEVRLKEGERGEFGQEGRK